MSKRDSFGSRLGFLLVSAGCAIGIGNVWRFPYVTGQNGGGLFVLLYIFFLIIMGVPVLTMELAVGRGGRNSTYRAIKTLEPEGSKWHIHGIVGMIGNYILMMFYTTVSGWMIAYFFKFATGTFSGMDTGAVDSVFDKLLSSPGELTLWMGITVVGGFLVLSLGIQNGLERVSKVMMAALMVLIIVLAVHSITLQGAGEGLSFYLVPSLERAREAGLTNVITGAMNQAFFTLSVGIGSMEIFGSYISKDHTLLGESLRICGLDTLVAICSGLIIFPACFSYGVQPDAGPQLIFMTLPKVFINMPGGRIWGTMFFLFMTFASFSTVIAVFENLLSNCVDNFGWNRRKAVILNMIFVFGASLPCVLGFNVLSNFTIGGKGVLDVEDFVVSNLLLPVGSLVFLLFCVTRLGWGYDNYLSEVNAGEGLKMTSNKYVRAYLRYVLPILILIILIQGLI